MATDLRCRSPQNIHGFLPHKAEPGRSICSSPSGWPHSPHPRHLWSALPMKAPHPNPLLPPSVTAAMAAPGVQLTTTVLLPKVKAPPLFTRETETLTDRRPIQDSAMCKKQAHFPSLQLRSPTAQSWASTKEPETWSLLILPGLVLLPGPSSCSQTFQYRQIQ